MQSTNVERSDTLGSHRRYFLFVIPQSTKENPYRTAKMGRQRKDPRKGLGWQPMVTMLLMLAGMLAMLLLFSDFVTASSRFLPNLLDVTAEPDDSADDAPGIHGHGILESRRALSEMDLVEADCDFSPVGSPAASMTAEPDDSADDPLGLHGHGILECRRTLSERDPTPALTPIGQPPAPPAPLAPN